VATVVAVVADGMTSATNPAPRTQTSHQPERVFSRRRGTKGWRMGMQREPDGWLGNAARHSHVSVKLQQFVSEIPTYPPIFS